MTRRAIILPSARDDLKLIARWIALEAYDVGVAERFVARLRARCNEISALPGKLGLAREELGPEIGSVAWRDYVILLRYTGDRFYVVRILHGMRDLPNVVNQEPES